MGAKLLKDGWQVAYGTLGFKLHGNKDNSCGNTKQRHCCLQFQKTSSQQTNLISSNRLKATDVSK